MYFYFCATRLLMLFNSFAFLLFFPVVVVLYYTIPRNMRWLLLLVAGFVFYMYYKAAYVLILVALIVVDYLAALALERTKLQHSRKLILLLSIVSNLGILFYFKYYNFSLDIFNYFSISNGFHPDLPYTDLLLPIGLSFHTFQSLSYTIEVYKGNYPAEKNIGKYALYVLFFPQLVAGPIERPSHLLPQLNCDNKFSYDECVSGLYRMTWGLFKKAVIADNIAIITDPVFAYPSRYSNTEYVICIFFFLFQLYCDFSGYTDMALGAARILGFKLSANFNFPLSATSIKDYWKRWHISLTSWFRDYVYLPLGGNKKGNARRITNIFIVFLLSGLWHGASINFVIWGILNAIGYLLIDRLIAKIPAQLKLLKQVLTLAYLMVTYAFFRAPTFEIATKMLAGIYKLPQEISNAIHKPMLFHTRVFHMISPVQIAYCLGLVASLLTVEKHLKEGTIVRQIKTSGTAFRWALYSAVVIYIYLFGQFGNHNFIYFQF